MSKAPRPDVHASTERLQVTASYARARLAFGAPLMLALSRVKSTAYRVSLPAQGRARAAHASILAKGCHLFVAVAEALLLLA